MRAFERRLAASRGLKRAASPGNVFSHQVESSSSPVPPEGYALRSFGNASHFMLRHRQRSQLVFSLRRESQIAAVEIALSLQK